jgi:hypothetical protein
MKPVNAKLPLIVVKRVYFDQFASGEKTVEYRRHRPPFTSRAFYPGRWVRITNNYNLARTPVLLAQVVSFEIDSAHRLLSRVPALALIYPDLLSEEEIAAIALAVQR